LEDIDSTDNVDSYKKDSPEGGSPEKLNLDRSSGDESMEEDTVEIKQDESNMKSDDLGGKNEFNSEDVKEVILPDSVVEASKEAMAEEKSAASTEKRKLEGLFLSLSFFCLQCACFIVFTWYKVPILSYNPYNSSEHANASHIFIFAVLL
jgi:hypothetical protein